MPCLTIRKETTSESMKSSIDLHTSQQQRHHKCQKWKPCGRFASVARFQQISEIQFLIIQDVQLVDSNINKLVADFQGRKRRKWGKHPGAADAQLPEDII